MRQLNTNEFDGVPGVTQCPVRISKSWKVEGINIMYCRLHRETPRHTNFELLNMGPPGITAISLFSTETAY